jgi:hypothetical protein
VSPTKSPDSKTVVVLFVAGAGLVIATFTYAFIRRWPTFDPLVTAGIVGIGLLLIVIYERLGHMHTELRTIAYQLELMSAESKDGARGRTGPTNHPTGASEGRSDAR